MSAGLVPSPRAASRNARASRPIGALTSQGIVAASSLLLQVIALNKLGATGLGSFSLLLGILITVNSIQSGWIGDSLTVLDRFEPGVRRALIRSQLVVVVLVAVVTTALALPVGGVDATTAVLFGLASVTWVVEETLRRLLIARREFWKLVVNDASFAAGSLGMIAVAVVSGTEFTIETLVLALFAGAVVATAVGVVQLPRVELSRGLLATSRMREVSSFAFWRAAQVGLRPGSQAVVRAIVATVVSLEALGQLETARLLLAPALTAVNGAGVYLLPTYSAQARRRERFRPAVPLAMLVVGSLVGAYGAVAFALRRPLLDLLDSSSTVISATALASWVVFAVGFGAGVPAGNAMVARGRSRTAFGVRCVDATVGILAATLLAVVGWVELVPAGLGVGTLVGAVVLLRRLGTSGARDVLSTPPNPGGRVSGLQDPVLRAIREGVPGLDDGPLVWQPGPSGPPVRRRPVVARGAGGRTGSTAVLDAPEIGGPVVDAPVRSSAGQVSDRLLWLVPLVLVVATEYKVRTRSIDDALSGSLDPFIAIELLIYGFIGTWAVLRGARSRTRFTPLVVVMWGYILTTAASALYSTFPMLGMARAVQLVIVGTVIHLLAFEGTVSTIGRLLHGWIVLMSVSILAGLAYVAPVTDAQVGRFTWLSVHSVSAGSMLAISVCVLFGLWLSAASTELPWPRHVYGALFLFQFVFLLLTRTRGSIGAAIVAIGAMAWVWSGNRMKPQLLLGSIVAGGALVLAFGEPIFQFLTRGETAEQIGTFNRRTEIWTLAWDAFLSHPLHGLGFTSARGVFYDETGLGGAHNALINVMIDAGLLGLGWWLWTIGATIALLVRLTIRRRRTVGGPQRGAAGSARADHLILMGVLVTSLLNSVTTEGLGAGVNVSAIWLFLCVAWLTVLDRD